MLTGCTTLLVEHFARLMAEASPELRLPALETLLARGTAVEPPTNNADALRAALFGLDPRQELPVGALTRLADSKPLASGERAVSGREYCLRVDPVTLQADLGRVVMTSHGFDGFDGEERQELENCIRRVLRDEGLELSADHPDRWSMVLPAPLTFSFVPLRDALGVDLADVMPGDAPGDKPGDATGRQAARDWRRIHNEIQVALYACSVNTQRRLAGQREINAVWIWGGGFLPEVPLRCPYRVVWARNPISRGLARLAGCVIADGEPEGILSAAEPGAPVLLDWEPRHITADKELMQLEQLLQGLTARGRGGGLIRWYGGSGMGWEYTRHCAWRFWRRRQPLAAYSHAVRNDR